MKIAEILRSANIPFVEAGQHHHARSGWINIDCPYCSSRGAESYHLGINLEYGYCNCWRCGRHKLLKVLQNASNISWGTIKGLLKDVEFETVEFDIKPQGKLVIPQTPGPLLNAHRQYLRGRGFDPEKLEKIWEIKAYGPTSGLRWRVFIPIIYHGETVSWTSRAIGKSSLRYISAKPEQERISHKELLYGEDYCRHCIIAVEGPLDTWTIGPGAVATLGLGFTVSQVKKLSKYPRRVICFDNEPSAQIRARQLCDQLEGFEGETYNVILSHKDANETLQKNPREIRKLREEFLE